MRHLILWIAFAGLFVVNAQAQAPGKTDHELLQGRWELMRREIFGKEAKVSPGAFIYVFKGENIILETPKVGKKSEPWPFRINTAQTPRHINFAIPLTGGGKDAKPHQYKGIYQLDGDNLKLCYKIMIPESSAGSKEANARPTTFDSKKGFLLELRRIK